MSQAEEEGFGEESSACSTVFFWRIFGGDYHMYHYSTPFTDNATIAKM